MNNISFKGFYQVEPIGNKRVYMKLVSEMVKTIPDTEAIESIGNNTKTVFVPLQEETQFEKLAEALKAKSLVHIRPINNKLPSIESLLNTKIRDFNPSDKYTYVTISAEEFSKVSGQLSTNKTDETPKYDLFRIALLDTPINIPEMSITKANKNSKAKKATSKDNIGSSFEIQIPNASKATINSFIKLGYKEIPVKIKKKSLRQIEELSKETGINLISRKITVLPFEKQNK